MVYLALDEVHWALEAIVGMAVVTSDRALRERAEMAAGDALSLCSADHQAEFERLMLGEEGSSFQALA